MKSRSPQILYSFPMRLGQTGTGYTAWEQAAGLIACGLDVTVVCATCDRPLPGARRIVETMKMCGVRVPQRLIGLDRTLVRHDRICSRLLAEESNVFDVLHCWPLGSLESLAVARRLGVVSFLERPNAHTAFAYEVVAEECRRLSLVLPSKHSHQSNSDRLARETAEYAAADYLACPSEFVARTFVERGFSRDRLAMHQYGFDPGRFRSGSQGDRSTGQGLKAAFVGSGEPRKGLHYALRAWLDSSAAEAGTFYVVGSFVPEYRKLIANDLIHPSIREVGFASDPRQIMQQCDVLVLPSVEEGSALVTYEARACGCVLMVSSAAGARCTHLHDGLVHEARDVETLKEQFTLLAGDGRLLSRLRANSLAGIEELTWTSAAERLRDLYVQAIDSRHERSGASTMALSL